jgi:hypothetical protein
MGKRLFRTFFVLAVVAGANYFGASSGAQSTLPSVALRSVAHDAEILRFKGEGVLWMPGGIYVAATNGAFELQATRRSDGTLDVQQMQRTNGSAAPVRALPYDRTTSFEGGLGSFFEITWTDARGRTVARQTTSWCPGAWWDAARTSDAGPDLPTYPGWCGSGLTRAAVWGIDDEWAAGALSSSPVEDVKIDDGAYTLRISIADAYARALEIPEAQRSASVGVTLTTIDDPCYPFGCGVAGARSTATAAARGQS